MSSSPVLRIHGEIESPCPLRGHAGEVTIGGWCLAEDLPDPPAVRLVAGADIVPLTRRTMRADVPNQFPAHSAAALCGFVLSGRLPAGVYLGSFEAQRGDGTWQVFKQLTLAVEPLPFAAVIDEPISHGILRDRVKVGGWALDTDEPVAELTLRYGHRELPCDTGLPRKDVPGLFPGTSYAGRTGFRSRDFLLAGHGPVRVRARLASGRIAIAPTKVVFSVATDENHPADLDLTVPRVGLDMPGSSRPPTLPAPVRTARSLNVLFVLHGSFASNSALHVAALANELAAAGHACDVAVPHDLGTLAHHDRPAFRGVTFAEGARAVGFPDGRGPDVIHAWTTRENVRVLTNKGRKRHQPRGIVHLEDNEQQLLALSLARDFASLDPQRRRTRPAGAARSFPSAPQSRLSRRRQRHHGHHRAALRICPRRKNLRHALAGGRRQAFLSAAAAGCFPPGARRRTRRDRAFLSRQCPCGQRRRSAGTLPCGGRAQPL